MSSFRKFTLLKIAENNGIVTDLVAKTLGLSDTLTISKDNVNSDFKNKFISSKPGKDRENLIFNEILKRGLHKQLVPVTIQGPSGVKLTYYTMPDYVMIDGVRVTMAPLTAQKVADHFNMKLPTDKMSQQIYQAADTKIRANPLSGSGYTDPNGKHYSAKDVVANRINQSDAAIFYNELTNEELEKQKKSGKTPILIAGHGKDILQPSKTGKNPRIGGWQGHEGNALQPYSDAHLGQAEVHTEYGLYTRLIDNKVTVTTPDGKTIETTLDKVMDLPQFSKLITDSPGVKKYQ